jgi:uncharacterized OB-fold protein
MSEVELRGIVQSYTVIRVPGQQLAAEGPFVLLLVELDDGRRVLGRFNGAEPPSISSRVMAQTRENATPSFRIAEETS